MSSLFPAFEHLEAENPKAITLELGSSQLDLRFDVLLVESERLLEHARELPDLFLETFLIVPSLPWVQQLRWNAFQLGGDREVESAEVLVSGLGEFTRVDGVDDPTSVLEWASGPASVLATSPARVDKPAVDLVLSHTLGQHLGVPSRLTKRIQSSGLFDVKSKRPSRLRGG